MIWPCVFIIMIPRSGANDATRATNKLCALQKSCDCPINHRHLEAKGWRTVLFTSLPAPINFILLFARRVTLGSAATTAGSLCLELSSQPSDYSYFKSDFMSTWAGPQHWRLRSKFSKGTYALLRSPTPVCGTLRFGGEVTVFESVFICVLRWCYTERFATTIFSATQRCNAGAML